MNLHTPRLPDTHELLELAALDVLGLLDAEEREAFERSFRAAPPALQAQVRREQTRLAGVNMDSLLPSVEPPLGLRARVLNAIREAVQTVSTRKDVAGRIVPALPLAPELAQARGVNRWWRAGAIGAVAASVVFGFVALQVRSDFQQLAGAVNSNKMQDHFLREYGAHFDRAFFNGAARSVHFSPAVPAERDADGVGKATLLLDTTTKKAQLYLKNLAANAGPYSLVVTDDQGNVSHAVLEFRTTGSGIEFKTIENLEIEGIRGLAIIEGGTGDVAAPTILRADKL
jgi:anti-sigma-K factor RskA